MTPKQKDILIIDAVILVASSIFGVDGIVCTFIGEILITSWLFLG